MRTGQTPRLSAALAPRADLQSFTMLPSNVKAIEAGIGFARGDQPLVAIFGPSGWGKTHLLEFVSSAMECGNGGKTEPVNALDFVNRSRLEVAGPLILDDLEDVLRQPRQRYQMRQVLERRVTRGRPTMVCFTGAKPTRATRAFLPSSRDWVIGVIGEPSADERELIVHRIAETEGLQLHRGVTRLIARRLHGNGRSIQGALQRLRLANDDWSRAEDLPRACGILIPYLEGADWDLRDEVYDAVSRTLAAMPNPTSAWVTDITAYMLRTEIGLPEADVAGFLRLRPATVYARAQAVARGMREEPLAQTVQACKVAVLRALDGA